MMETTRKSRLGFTSRMLLPGTVTVDSPDTQGDAGGVLDLGNGDLITSVTSVSTIQTLLAAGYDNGFWDGESTTGGVTPAVIVSSGAAADPYQIESLGYAEIGTATGSLNLSTFDGQAVSSGDVVVALTYYGDANLDRMVNSTDNGIVDDVAVTAPVGWTTGDYNYDGVVNSADQQLASVAGALLASFHVGSTNVTIPPGGNTGTSTLTGGPAAATTGTPTTVRIKGTAGKYGQTTWTVIPNPGFGVGIVGGSGTTLTTPLTPPILPGVYQVTYQFDNGLGFVTVEIQI